MPMSPPSLCTTPGCGQLVPAGKCETHRAQSKREAEARRAPRDRSYDTRWREASKRYLALHPLCESEKCSATPFWKRPAATDTDHIDGLGPSGPRGYDPTNWQALCHSCHSSKTARRDGGFGNPKKRGNQ